MEENLDYWKDLIANLDQEPKFENSLGMLFHLIPPGEFLMGSNDHLESRPIHRVKITQPFYLGIFPVTQKYWFDVVGTEPSSFKGPNRPVERITYDEIMEFISRISDLDKRKYRLPTEAEWEYACRAGTNTKYYFGENDLALGSYAWYHENSKDAYSLKRETHDVGLLKPNNFGLHDMLGNVCEYCSDFFDEDYYSEELVIDPKGPENGEHHVNRGGCYNYPMNSPIAYKSLTCGGRRLQKPKRDQGHGFRLAISICP